MRKPLFKIEIHQGKNDIFSLKVKLDEIPEDLCSSVVDSLLTLSEAKGKQLKTKRENEYDNVWIVEDEYTVENTYDEESETYILGVFRTTNYPVYGDQDLVLKAEGSEDGSYFLSDCPGAELEGRLRLNKNKQTWTFYPSRN